MGKPQPTFELRKPPVAVDLARAELFVSGAEIASQLPTETARAITPITPQQLERATPPQLGAGSTSGVEMVPQRQLVFERSDGRALHRTTIYLPIEVSRQLKQRSAEARRTLSDVVADALRAYLG